MNFKPKNAMKRVLYFLVELYIGLAVYAMFFSEHQIFLPQPSSYRDTPEILKLRSSNGNRISALHLTNPSAQYTLLVSHGNAEDLGDDRGWLSDLQKSGFNVFAYDYQGYGTSEGRPSEKGTYDDENAAYDYLVNTMRVRADRIILFGRSVGTGPAVHVAASRPAAALILQSPFLSAFRVLTRVPILPFDKFPNYKTIAKVRCPVLVIHGMNDEVIGFWHGQKLFSLANEPKQFWAVPHAGHNDVDLVGGSTYLKTLQAFSHSLVKEGTIPRNPS